MDGSQEQDLFEVLALVGGVAGVDLPAAAAAAAAPAAAAGAAVSTSLVVLPSATRRYAPRSWQLMQHARAEKSDRNSKRKLTAAKIKLDEQEQQLQATMQFPVVAQFLGLKQCRTAFDEQRARAFIFLACSSRLHGSAAGRLLNMHARACAVVASAACTCRNKHIEQQLLSHLTSVELPVLRVAMVTTQFD